MNPNEDAIAAAKCLTEFQLVSAAVVSETTAVEITGGHCFGIMKNIPEQAADNINAAPAVKPDVLAM
jgi:hypothetical protein